MVRSSFLNHLTVTILAPTAHRTVFPPTSGTWRLYRNGVQNYLYLMAMASEELGSKLEPRCRSDMSCNCSKCNVLVPDLAFPMHSLLTAPERGSVCCVPTTSHLPAIPPKQHQVAGTLQLHSSAALSHPRGHTKTAASCALFKGTLTYPLTGHQKNQS